jgi:hypothetical protein
MDPRPQATPRGRCVRCLTSPRLIRLYCIVNLVVWATVVVLAQGVLPVLHGCAGIIIALEGVFATSSKDESSVRVFIALMMLNLVFCVVMGPLTIENVYLECYGCSSDSLDANGTNRIYVEENTQLCVPDAFCERAFGLYGWILVIFGAVLQLPIFLFTVGFYFAVSRGSSATAAGQQARRVVLCIFQQTGRVPESVCGGGVSQPRACASGVVRSKYADPALLPPTYPVHGTTAEPLPPPTACVSNQRTRTRLCGATAARGCRHCKKRHRFHL